MVPRRRGRLIAFEGGEGCGKSTQAARMAEEIGALLTHEPGATPLGAELRRLALQPPGAPAVESRAETLMMLADRAQHVAEVVRPALDAGTDVVTDRYSHSTLAYQGYGRGLDIADLRQLCGWATGELWPDLVVLLTVPRQVAVARAGRPTDRLEAAGEDFHRRVTAGFEAMAAGEPHRWLVVDGSGDEDGVAALVLEGWSAWEASRPERPERPGE
ncbi:MAG TPA: dTMP kinase [Acidimicrobiales bacterium]|nr:dTMP kinase [Acidimicrobiales bacterium]